MWKIKQIGLCALCLAALLLWYGAAVCQKKAAWFDGSAAVHWEEGKGVSPQQMAKAADWQRKDGGTAPPFVLWRTQPDQMLYGDFYPIPAKGEVLEYYGEIPRLLPCQFRSGSWPGESLGCVIDEGLADALWGSCEDAVGRPLRWNKNTWYVRGVFAGTEKLAVIPASEEDESCFAGLWLDFSAENGGGTEAEQLLRKYRLPEGQVTDLGFFVWICGIMAGFPVFLLWGWAALDTAVRFWKLRHTGMLLTLSAPLLLAAFAAVSWAAGFPWRIPERFLPTRWSDGAFWSGFGQWISDGVSTVFHAAPAVWEKLFWENIFRCGVMTVPAVVLLWFIVRILPAFSPKMIFWCSLVWWTILFGAAWQNRNSLFAFPPLVLWVLPTVWMAWKWLMELYTKWLMLK